MNRIAIRRIALAFGIVFALIGIFGFVPMFTSNSQDTTLLFSALAVGSIQNIMYGVTGLVGIACSVSYRSARLFFISLGAIYGLLSLVGFFLGDTIFGLFTVNLSNNLLNYVVALTGIILGFWPLPKETNV